MHVLQHVAFYLDAIIEYVYDPFEAGILPLSTSAFVD